MALTKVKQQQPAMEDKRILIPALELDWTMEDCDDCFEIFFAYLEMQILPPDSTFVDTVPTEIGEMIGDLHTEFICMPLAVPEMDNRFDDSLTKLVSCDELPVERGEIPPEMD